MQEIEAIAATGSAEQAWESTHENELKSNAEQSWTSYSDA